MPNEIHGIRFFHSEEISRRDNSIKLSTHDMNFLSLMWYDVVGQSIFDKIQNIKKSAFDISRFKGKLHISTKKYTSEIVRSFQLKYGYLKKKIIPMSVEAHPELDTSSLLDINEQKMYQHIIGTC